MPPDLSAKLVEQASKAIATIPSDPRSLAAVQAADEFVEVEYRGL